MSEFIEPTIEEIEIPIEEETQTETENSNGSEMESEILLPQRVNPFCVISKNVVEVEDINGKNHDLHMIETNSSWGINPYGEDYAVVPDDMVTAIMETRGFCDVTLNEDGTEVVEFTAREIPEIPAEEITAEPTANDIINAMLGLEG